MRFSTKFSTYNRGTIIGVTTGFFKSTSMTITMVIGDTNWQRDIGRKIQYPGITELGTELPYK